MILPPSEEDIALLRKYRKPVIGIEVYPLRLRIYSVIFERHVARQDHKVGTALRRNRKAVFVRIDRQCIYARRQYFRKIERVAPTAHDVLFQRFAAIDKRDLLTVTHFRIDKT